MEKRSFLQEVILTMADVDHLELLTNFLFNLDDLGLEHHLVLMHSKDECQKLLEIFPDACRLGVQVGVRNTRK